MPTTNSKRRPAREVISETSVWVHIALYLEERNLQRLAQACRLLREAANKDKVWASLLTRARSRHCSLARTVSSNKEKHERLVDAAAVVLENLRNSSSNSSNRFKSLFPLFSLGDSKFFFKHLARCYSNDLLQRVGRLQVNRYETHGQSQRPLDPGEMDKFFFRGLCAPEGIVVKEQHQGGDEHKIESFRDLTTTLLPLSLVTVNAVDDGSDRGFSPIGWSVLRHLQREERWQLKRHRGISRMLQAGRELSASILTFAGAFTVFLLTKKLLGRIQGVSELVSDEKWHTHHRHNDSKDNPFPFTQRTAFAALLVRGAMELPPAVRLVHGAVDWRMMFPFLIEFVDIDQKERTRREIERDDSQSELKSDLDANARSNVGVLVAEVVIKSISNMLNLMERNIGIRFMTSLIGVPLVLGAQAVFSKSFTEDRDKTTVSVLQHAQAHLNWRCVALIGGVAALWLSTTPRRAGAWWLQLAVNYIVYRSGPGVGFRCAFGLGLCWTIVSKFAMHSATVKQ